MMYKIHYLIIVILTLTGAAHAQVPQAGLVRHSYGDEYILKPQLKNTADSIFLAGSTMSADKLKATAARLMKPLASRPDDYADLTGLLCDALGSNPDDTASGLQDYYAITALSMFPRLDPVRKLRLVFFVEIAAPPELADGQATRFRNKRLRLWLETWREAQSRVGPGFEPNHPPEPVIPVLSASNHVDKIIMYNEDPSAIRDPVDKAAYAARFQMWQKECADYRRDEDFYFISKSGRQQIINLLSTAFKGIADWKKELAQACYDANVSPTDTAQLIQDAQTPIAERNAESAWLLNLPSIKIHEPRLSPLNQRTVP